jgi:prepilin peptidase CpaA
MTPLALPLQVLLGCITLAAGFTDLRSRTIPNSLVIVGLVFGFGLNTYLLHWNGFVRSVAGFALAAAVYVPLFALRAMGGGDVKLMAAVGAIAGAANWFVIFLFTSVIGGLFAIILLLFTGTLRKTIRNVGHILNEIMHLRVPHRSRRELDVSSPSAVTMPHGVAIAAGVILYLLLSRF